MLDVSLSEILLIVVVAVVAIGPKELPVVLRAVIRGWRTLRGLLAEMRKGMDGLLQEAQIQELRDDIKKQAKILDLNGEWQETYDLSDFMPPDNKVSVVPAQAGTHALLPADTAEAVDPGLRRDNGEGR